MNEYYLNTFISRRTDMSISCLTNHDYIHDTKANATYTGIPTQVFKALLKRLDSKRTLNVWPSFFWTWKHPEAPRLCPYERETNPIGDTLHSRYLHSDIEVTQKLERFLKAQLRIKSEFSPTY